MSTGLECSFEHVTTDGVNEWFYVLENWDAPANAWDWSEHATAYGPFKTYESAYDHLCCNHTNTGGHSIAGDAQALTAYPAHMQALYADARARRK
jgi:hypothetical protein